MAIQHEITRDLLVEYMRTHQMENVEELTDLYKKIYNTVEESTDSSKYGFKDSKES